MVFKLSREEKNDGILADEEIPKLLIEILGTASLKRGPFLVASASFTTARVLLQTSIVAARWCI